MIMQEENANDGEAIVTIENAEELDSLPYELDSDIPVFESIHVTKKDFSLYELYRKYKKEQLVLDVDFQRRDVWSQSQKNELIESILIGLPLPIFYLQQQNNSVYVVVDGKQRLSAIFQFFDNAFPLKGLKILPFVNNKRYKDLEGELGIYQSQFEDYQVYSHLILPSTPSYLVFDIFDRVNRGGTKLNKQEIRNALYHGKGLRMIDEVARSKAFIEATRIDYDSDKRMKGSYLLTRFASFFLYEEGMIEDYKYDGNVDKLIEVVLKQLNECSESFLDTVRDILESALIKCHDILGSGAFRKGASDKNPINMNIFEAQMFLMSMIGDSKKEAIIGKEQLRERINSVVASDDFQWCIGDGRDSVDKVIRRFEMMKDILR